MLLRANCIGDRNCPKCKFESECIVQRTMYSKFVQKPDFVTTGESVGYVLECENYTEQFCAGEKMEFSLLLFGKTIVYFNLYMQAFYTLGLQGVGKNKSRFRIVSVTNSQKEQILDENNNIYMKRYKVMKLEDYVTYRMRDKEAKDTQWEILLKTPLTLKYQGEFLQEFHSEALIKAIIRRIYMLDCFEGLELSYYNLDAAYIPQIVFQNVYHIAVPRYSSRQADKMVLHGIEGRAVLENVNGEIAPLLYAGELMHIGKNTSFGFGRIKCRGIGNK